jgi:hypothetical protein
LTARGRYADFIPVSLAVNDAMGVIRVAPTGSNASPNVRYAFNSDRICASVIHCALLNLSSIGKKIDLAPYSFKV